MKVSKNNLTMRLLQYGGVQAKGLGEGGRMTQDLAP